MMLKRRKYLVLAGVGLLVGVASLSALAAQVVDFTVDPQTPIVGQVVTFTENLSGFPEGYITSYDWDFGDGATDNGESVEHQFAIAGEFRVTLTVTDTRGGETMRTKTVTVVQPEVDFDFAPTVPTTQDSVHFTGMATPPQGVAGWSWIFGDGGGANVKNPVYTFTQRGTYRVILTVTYETGASATKVREITVVNSPPVADFRPLPPEPKVGEQVTFITEGSGDPDGSIVSYAWDFDSDGQFEIQGGDSARTVVYTFDRGGDYDVTLRVTDNEGASTTITRTVPIRWSAPIADFTPSSTTPKIGETVTFDGSASTDAEGDDTIVLYQWDFDGDGGVDAQGKTVNHAFSVAGAVPVTLTVTDDTGLKGNTTKWINVQSTPPTAAFTFAPPTPDTGQVVSFDATGSDDPDGSIILYEWDFGDGSPKATGMAVTHAFQEAGVYPVQLKVTDNDGEFDVMTQAVPIQVGGTGGVNQPPVADFIFEPAEGPDVNLNEVVTFKADGCSDPDGTVVSYEWDFNNDGIYDATGTEVSHIFHRGGGQIVTLRVRDDEGTPGFKTKVVPVQFISPIAGFTFSPENPKVGEVVTFDGSPSSDADGRVDFYEWDFDSDGNPDATGMTVTHVFTEGGSRAVTLKVTDNDGVTGFITKTIPVRINTPPYANFSYEPVNPKVSETVTFTSTSIDADGTITTWLWDFGDGTTTSEQTPSHKYAAAGTYAVVLTVTDDEGAIGQKTKDVTVTAVSNRAPVASFTFAPALPGVNQEVQFTDRSTDEDDNITGWAWDFGDGTTSEERNPKHTYTSEGTYTVTLRVTDAAGLTDAATKQVVVGGGEVGLYGYPNPARVTVTIAYALPDGATDPILRIYDLTGRLVRKEELPAGETTYLWDLRDDAGDPLPNGLYFCIVSAKNAKGSKVFSLLIVR